MLYSALKYLALQCIVGLAVILLSMAIVALAQGSNDALLLGQIAIIQMKGPWVWTTGYGLMWFIMRIGRGLAADLQATMEPSQSTTRAISLIEKSTLHRNALVLTVGHSYA